jgi:hypothetical protein
MVVMEMRWQGVTPEQYDEAKRRVDWETNPHPQGRIHIAWFEDGALRCYDVWESEAAFADFTENRLIPGIQGLGIEGPPDVKFHRVHDTHVNELALAGALA